MQIASLEPVVTSLPFWEQPLCKRLNIEPAEQFLSTADAYDILAQKKITPINLGFDVGDRGVETIALMIGVASIVVATLVFSAVASEGTTIDHSGDVITSYRYKHDYQARGSCAPFFNSSGYWIDHTQDVIVPAFELAGKKALAIALAAPALFYMVCKTSLAAITAYQQLRNRQSSQAHEERAVIKCALRSAAAIDHHTSAEAWLISKLVAMQELSGADLKKLSFQQIKQLKKADEEYFKRQLTAKEFSEPQNLYWDKLAGLLKASEEQLIEALQNRYNCAKFFAKEPYMLETLLQELPLERLSPRVIDILVTLIQSLTDELRGQSKQATIAMIKQMSTQKISFEKAFHNLALNVIEDNETVQLGFRQSNKHVTLEVPKLLLKAFSPVFYDMFVDVADGKGEQIFLEGIDPKAFEAVVNYLSDGSLPRLDVDIEAIVEVIEKYDFAHLKHNLEIDLCLRVHELTEGHSHRKLLEMCQNYCLHGFKMALENRWVRALETHAPFAIQSFISDMQLAHDYKLVNVSESLFNRFNHEAQERAAESDFMLMAVEMASWEESSLNSVLKVYTPLFEKKPMLLKRLFECAQQKSCWTLQEALMAFCEQDEKLTYLACWPVVPKLPILEPLTVLVI